MKTKKRYGVGNELPDQSKMVGAELKGILIILYADLAAAILICGIGQSLQMAYGQSLNSLCLSELFEVSENLPSGDIAALLYLWNPFTIVTCLGSNTSPIENLAVILSLYGACRDVKEGFLN